MFDDRPVKEQLQRGWTDYWRAEVRRLVKDDTIAKAILVAVGHQNSPEGEAAEGYLAELIHQRYADEASSTP